MADSKHALKFLEGGVRMRFNVDLEFLRVEFAPVAPAFLGSQRSGLRGGQIAVNRPPPKIKTPGGLDFGPTLVDELHHPFPQIQRIGFHAQKPVRLCANVNMNCSTQPDAHLAGTPAHVGSSDLVWNFTGRNEAKTTAA